MIFIDVTTTDVTQPARSVKWNSELLTSSHHVVPSNEDRSDVLMIIGNFFTLKIG